MIIYYLITDYLLYEKKQMDIVEDELRNENYSTKEEKKVLEELADWHFQNCMRAVKEKGIPRCVQDYVYEYRKEPTIREIEEGYKEIHKFFEERNKKREKSMLIIAIPFTIIMVVSLILLLL